MKVITRSQWTASYPKPTVGTEDQDGLPNLRVSEVTGISLCQPDVYDLFVERDPFKYFHSLEKEDYTVRGYGDIQYNLGVASNVEGVFCLRGLCNKSVAHTRKDLNSRLVSILLLLGNDERPTDLMVRNLNFAKHLIQGRFPNANETFLGRTTGAFKQVAESIFSEAPPVGQKTSSTFNCQLSNTFSTETSVHVFELIETLAYWGYYKGRNDGVYGQITRQAVRELQADLRLGNLYLKPIDGQFGRYTREAFCLYLKNLGRS